MVTHIQPRYANGYVGPYMPGIICEIDNDYLRAPPEGKRGHQSRAMHIADDERTTYPRRSGLFFHSPWLHIPSSFFISLGFFFPLVSFLREGQFSGQLLSTRPQIVRATVLRLSFRDDVGHIPGHVYLFLLRET